MTQNMDHVKVYSLYINLYVMYICLNTVTNSSKGPLFYVISVSNCLRSRLT
jgi:hypothetical protein